MTSKELTEYPALNEHVMGIHFCEIDQNSEINMIDTELIYHIYTLDEFGSEVDTIEYNGEDDGELPSANLWSLPSKDFYGLWENLIFDSKIKEDTLHFVETTLLFSDHNVDPNVINWNRVVLLHGPPGTGKTSLCKALAQKLSIRLGERYKRAQLIEINSHSLFSKWFSESGKLVMKLFNKIKETVEDPTILVCVLIDEVESLTHARKAALSGLEPSDSIRVVNAILTQIDQIKKFSNVIIMTTSNMTGAIDLAFVDRADIKQYIGLPSQPAIYQIYYSCITELMRVGIITPPEKLFTYHLLKMCHFTKNETTESSLDLLRLAAYSEGLSGRALRKIPFLAHALFVNTPFISLSDYLKAMCSTIKKHLADSEIFTKEFNAIKIKGDLNDGIAENLLINGR